MIIHHIEHTWRYDVTIMLMKMKYEHTVKLYIFVGFFFSSFLWALTFLKSKLKKHMDIT